MREIVLMHRQHSLKGERVEHLISLVPHETIMSAIGRIRPESGDEIVIKVLDESIDPNKAADQIMYHMMSLHHELNNTNVIRSGPDDKDDLPF